MNPSTCICHEHRIRTAMAAVLCGQSARCVHTCDSALHVAPGGRTIAHTDDRLMLLTLLCMPSDIQFNTSFAEMDALSGRNQTTKGIWLARSPKVRNSSMLRVHLPSPCHAFCVACRCRFWHPVSTNSDVDRPLLPLRRSTYPAGPKQGSDDTKRQARKEHMSLLVITGQCAADAGDGPGGLRRPRARGGRHQLRAPERAVRARGRRCAADQHVGQGHRPRDRRREAAAEDNLSGDGAVLRALVHMVLRTAWTPWRQKGIWPQVDSW